MATLVNKIQKVSGIQLNMKAYIFCIVCSLPIVRFLSVATFFFLNNRRANSFNIIMVLINIRQ